METGAQAQLSLVHRVITHPGFNGDTFENDIAVISVEQGADFQGKCYFVVRAHQSVAQNCNSC